MKKARAPLLTEERIEEVVQLLDSWQGKLTWEALASAIDARFGFTYSRYTLAGKSRISLAFELAKARPAARAKPPGIARDRRVRAAIERADRATAKAERLAQENQRLLEQFQRWASNALAFGIDLEVLNRPLIKPDREQSRVPSEAELIRRRKKR